MLSGDPVRRLLQEGSRDKALVTSTRVAAREGEKRLDWRKGQKDLADLAAGCEEKRRMKGGF